MADLLPFLPDTRDAGGDDPRVVGVDSEEADDLLAALSSRTARRILTELHDDPATPSLLADRVDTSIQNVQYHLGNLEDAGIVEIVDTAYSEKGREMNVYAPADRALVVMAGPEEETSGLKTALSRLLGSLGILALASVILNRLLTGPARDVLAGGKRADDGGDAGAYQTKTTDSANVSTETATPGAETAATSGATETPQATPQATGTPAPEPTPTAVPTESASATPAPERTATPVAEATRTAVETTAAASDGPGSALLAFTSTPGFVFFLGGTTVLVGGFALWYLRNQH